MSKVKINQLLVISLLGFGLTACGGGGGGGNSGPTVNSGVFKDSAVKGISYISGGQKGITGKNGEFKYEAGKDISFSVGAIKLGTAKGKNIITPVDLVSGGKPDTLEVVNRVRFLLLLDKNNKPEDGIEISTEVQNKFKKLTGKKKDIDFKKSKADFENELGYVNGLVDQLDGDREVKTFDQAKAHLGNTLKVIASNKRCTDSGVFTGTYTGTEKGNIAVLLDPSTGKIKGTIFNTDKSGNFVPRSDVKFSGKLEAGNTLKGTWVDNKDAKKKGDFSTKRIAGNSGANYRYSAIYGMSKGILAINVKAKQVSGKVYDVRTGSKLDIISGKINSTTKMFENVKLSNNGAITGFTTDSIISGTIKEDSNNFNSFAGNGCKLN